MFAENLSDCVGETPTGFSEVEIAGDSRCLYVYGDAFQSLKSTKVQGTVNGVVFKYAPFPRICESGLRQLEQLSHLEHLTLSHNHLGTLGEIEMLGRLLPPTVSKLQPVKRHLIARRFLKAPPLCSQPLHTCAHRAPSSLLLIS